VEFASFAGIIRRWWWTLVIAVWVAAVAGYLLASRLPPTYESRTTVIVGPVNGDVETVRASALLVQTYSELATSDQVLSGAAKAVGQAVPIADLRTRINATADDVTRLVTIRADDGDPTRAAHLASAIAAQLVSLSAGDTSRPEGAVQVVNAADIPVDPVAPRTSLVVLLAGLAGLLGAIILVVAIEALSSSVRSATELTKLVPAPLLASIPPVRLRRTDPPLVIDADPRSDAAGAYRLLAARLGVGEDERPVERLHIAGIEEADGAGEVAANLARYLAETGLQVGVVDAEPGHLASTLLAADPDDDGAMTPDNGQLREIRAWSGIPTARYDAAEATGRQPWEEATETLRRLSWDSRLLIIVGPGLLEGARSLSWAAAADGTLLVVQRDATPRDEVSAAVDSLRLVHARLIGTVLVQSRRALPGLRRVAGRRPTKPAPASQPSTPAFTAHPSNGRERPATATAQQVTPTRLREHPDGTRPDRVSHQAE